SVITAVRKGVTTVFQVNGKPLGPEATAALDIVASLNVDGTFDDRVLGSEQPRGIGESWAMNVDEAVKVFQKNGSDGISKSDLFGLTTLVDMMEHRGQPCLVLHTQLSTENVIPGFDVPAGMSVKQANATAMFQGFFPIDETLPPLTDSMRLDMTAVLTGSGQGQPVELRINGVRIVDLEQTPLPSSTASVTPSEME
ncbi:MAG: hypothetical protein HKO59_12375, partial [Phycisphaerales bacterium]|nr:hypothetical protein [Phycisphaerales bacterium]